MAEATQSTAVHELTELTATQAARLIRARELSPVELVEKLLTRAAKVDQRVQAWVHLDGERALAAARTAEQLASSSVELPALLGVPFGAKDIFDSAGLATAAGFGPFANRVPATDAEPIARLKRAGAILLGKMVTTQFAQADPSRTHNPWSDDRTPGGSSSGSAAGVAARLVPLALGSQTAGSVLRPAAYNGVVGFKPTYGRVSKRGVFPLAWSLDHVGSLTRCVEDCELFLTAAAGHDPADPGSENQPPPVLEAGRDLAAPRLGLIREALQIATPRMREHLVQVAAQFEAAGARVEDVSLGEPLDLILAVQHVIMQTEVAAVHWQLLERYPGSHLPRLRASIEVGRLVPGVVYLHAQRLRRRIRAAMSRGLANVDALLLPTATDAAPSRETTGDTSLQAPFSLVGFPSLSLPSGLLRLETESLPLAIQLVAPAWQEARLLAVGRWCEAQLPSMPPPPLYA